MKSSTWASASASVRVEASTALSSPDSRCMFTTTGSISSSACSGAAITRSMPVAELVQLPVGHQAGHFEQQVAGQVKPGHLAIDPNEAVVHVAKVTSQPPSVRPGARIPATRVWRTAHTHCVLAMVRQHNER